MTRVNITRGDIYMGLNLNIYEVAASNIKKYRKKAKLTQKQPAELTDYSHEYIRRIEAPKCKNSFTIESVYVISKALGVPMYMMFETKKRVK